MFLKMRNREKNMFTCCIFVNTCVMNQENLCMLPPTSSTHFPGHFTDKVGCSCKWQFFQWPFVCTQNNRAVFHVSLRLKMRMHLVCRLYFEKEH